MIRSARSGAGRRGALKLLPAVLAPAGLAVIAVVVPSPAHAQKPGTITTVVATGAQGFAGDKGPALKAQLTVPLRLLIDGTGNLFIVDGNGTRIRKVDRTGIITSVAGDGQIVFTPDGQSAVGASVYAPEAALDGAGSIFTADSQNNRVRKIVAGGVITTVAGSGTQGFLGDGGVATDAQTLGPGGVAVDAAGNVYFSDTGNDRIRKVDPAGIITTIAGSGDLDAQGQSGFSGDHGPATDAQLNHPGALALDAEGNLYVLDTGNRRIRKIDPKGIITTVIGNGKPAGSPEDGMAATESGLTSVGQILLDSAGDLLFADSYWGRIRKVGKDGILTTIAGGGAFGDGRPAVNASLAAPTGIALDASGNLFIAEGNRVREVFAAGPPGLVPGKPGGGGPPGAAVPGDVDLNGKVEVADATLVLLFTVDLAVLTKDQQAAADVNGDGAVNIQDAVLILMKAIGL